LPTLAEIREIVDPDPQLALAPEPEGAPAEASGQPAKASSTTEDVA